MMMLLTMIASMMTTTAMIDEATRLVVRLKQFVIFSAVVDIVFVMHQIDPISLLPWSLYSPALHVALATDRQVCNSILICRLYIYYILFRKKQDT